MDFCEVHTFRLHGVQHVDANLDQVLDKRLHEATGVVENNHIRVDRPGRVHHPFQAGLEPCLVEFLAHHDGVLHSDVVSEIKYFRTCFYEIFRPMNSQFRHFVQYEFRHFIFGHHVHHQYFHAPHVPGGFPDGALHAAADYPVLGFQGIVAGKLSGHILLIPDKFREGIGFQLLKGLYFFQRMEHVGHVHGRRTAGFVCHAVDIDGGSLFQDTVIFAEFLRVAVFHRNSGCIGYGAGRKSDLPVQILYLPAACLLQIRTKIVQHGNPFISRSFDQ